MDSPAPDGPVRLLGIDDLPACQRLAEDRDWGREDRKWRFLFSVGDVYGIDGENGELAGTVVSTPYGKDVAAISMVLVAKRYERRGLGGRLMRHTMDNAGTASLCLTATEYGRPLYERLGFRSVGLCTTYKGVAEGLSKRGLSKRGLSKRGLSVAVEAGDMPAVHALDTEVFGADRTQVIKGLPSFCESLRAVRFHVRDGRGRGGRGVAGFAGAWLNDDLTSIGPVIAQNTETALTLADEITPPGRPVRLDVDHRHPELVTWAETHGLRPAFTTTIMEYGDPIGGDPSRLYLPVAQALG